MTDLNALKAQIERHVFVGVPLVPTPKDTLLALIAVAEAAKKMKSFALAMAVDQMPWDEDSPHPLQRLEDALANLEALP